MPPAVAIAGIGAAAGIGGSLLSSKAQKKAANQASDTAAQTAAMNNQLAREIYGQNKDTLNPFVQRGNKAGDAINALLGLGGSGAEQDGGQQVPQQGAYSQQNAFSQPVNGFGGEYGDLHNQGFQPNQYSPQNAFQHSGAFNPVGGGGFGYGEQPQNISAAPQQTAQSAQEQQENAFDVFRDSTGYQFRLSEGQDALNSGFAGRGSLRSGAAAKSFADYNQNVASNEFGNYMGYLGNQQGVGLQGASALAGVSQNFVGQTSANNNSAGTVAANAALAKGQANSDLFSNIGSSFGNLAGSIFG